MRDRDLRRNFATNHYIHLNLPDAPPIHALPHLAGSRHCKPEKEEIKQMLIVDVAEPATTKWESPTIFMPINDKSLWLCVEYKRFNAVIAQVRFCIPSMNECNDSPRKSQIFWQSMPV